jgi:hypothetical protein
MAASLAARVRRRNAQVRRSFVERGDEAAPTPLALLLRGGRGGQVRLKLLLSLLWVAANPPHDATYPARVWAELLGLPDPEGNGARRINDAIGWLGAHHFLEIRQRPGQPTTLILLHETGSGEPYTVPGATLVRLRNANAAERSAHRYLNLPSSFWTSGWIGVLSGSAVAMLLVLLLEFGSRRPTTESPDEVREVWFSPAVAEQRYALSEDTRSAGLRELERYGLVTTRRRRVSPDALDFRRLRNTYVLHPETLNQTPHISQSLHRHQRQAAPASNTDTTDEPPF